MNRLNKLKKVKFLLSECELFDEDDINIINKEIEKEQLNDNNKENNQYEQTETAPKKESKKFNVNNFDEADHINRIGAIFRTQKEISYAELVEEIKQIYGIGTNGAKQKIIPFLTGNNFIKSNKGIYTRITNK